MKVETGIGKDMRLGIDFGTCFSSAALIADGNLVRVKDPIKHGYSFPSSVYAEPDNNFLVGYGAEFKRNIEPQRYCSEFKRNLGSDTPYQLGERQLMPEQLVAEILAKLRTEADKIINYGYETLKNAVITVPATYQNFTKSLMQRAAENAGFEDVQLLPEPVAAAIYSAKKYDIKDGEIILVYDLGGGTFDSTLIQKLGATAYKLLGIPVGDSHCGGIDFDREIYIDFNKNCSESFRELLKPQQLTKQAYIARSSVAEICRDIKHQLSENNQAETQVILTGQIEHYKLSRKTFNGLIAPYINKTIQLCDKLVVTNANLSWEKVDRILMVGGSCHIPYIQQVLKQKFQRPIYIIDEPDLAVCLGAAIHAKKLDDEQTKYKNKTQNKSQVTPQPTKYFDNIEEKNLKLERNEQVNKPPKNQQSTNSSNNTKEQAEAFYQEGLRSIKLGNYQAAANSLWHTILLNDTKTDAYLYRGFATFCLGDALEAIRHCERVIKINPNVSDTYVCRGLAYIAESKYDQALKDFNQAITIDDNKGGYLGRCVTYTFLNQHKSAISDYKHLQNVAHTFDTNGYNRAIVKTFKGDRTTILEYLKKASQAYLIELKS